MARFNPLNYYNCCNPDNARGQKTLPYNIFSQNPARVHCHAWHEFLTLRRKDAKIFVVGGLDGLDGWHPHAYSAYELHEPLAQRSQSYEFITLRCQNSLV